ncbi:SERINE/THREONINE-PROTEIN KINASE-LIKE PROTEIN [Salix koriyanagi]|uniref:SERINE/THREONINE-PROTEIN KINASE-LIKE PROTEIN n=1 Tax=Salix koriyanagi TaxID=2511006 RepID=A0A9Q0X1K1_9ROSI|nr:SERINE/THREONINE-PROTEIN KINASE-LIKE PROTEIN [Salix koriyanagi]
MGYLSCKADSAIAIISTTPASPASSSTSRTKQEKTIKIQKFNYSDIEAATDGFSDQNLLGKGSHGCVYKAVLRGRHVAVKKPSKGLEIGQEVDSEIEILSKIHSPRLGKLGAIYDPRTVPLKDPMIRKQLALIASKCVRSCRERRPAMKEVVDWLTALSKLVPLHSWNGFNNPCMMVDTMGCPAELRNIPFGSRPQGDGEEILEGMGRRSVMGARRVYSDLGIRSNLKELMAGTDSDL